MLTPVKVSVNEIGVDFIYTLKNIFQNDSIVVLPEAEYRELARIRHNAEYLAQLEKGMQDLQEGRCITKTMAELEAMANE